MKKYFVLFLCLMIFLFYYYNSEPEGSTMPDGSIQYRMLNISNKKELEFKDANDNVLLDENDVAWVYEKYSEACGYYLILEFTGDGTSKEAEAIKDNIGKEISLFADGEKVFSAMVVEEITDGEKVFSPMIVAEITDGNIAIIGETSNYKQLKELTEKITS